MRLTLRQRLTGYIPPRPPTLSTLSYSPWTPERWRASDSHVQFMRDLMERPEFKDLLGVLNNARPYRGDPADDPARLLGRREGYDQLMGLLLSLAEYEPTPPSEVPITYGAEEFQADQQ